MSDEQGRYRLSIDFTARNALFDFVELLKWGEFLPRDAEVRRLRPGVLSEAPTEEYIVSASADPPRV
jgi:hypothetical protein